MIDLMGEKWGRQCSNPYPVKDSFGLRSRGSVVRIHSSAPPKTPVSIGEFGFQSSFPKSPVFTVKHGKTRQITAVDGGELGETNSLTLCRFSVVRFWKSASELATQANRKHVSKIKKIYSASLEHSECSGRHASHRAGAHHGTNQNQWL